MTTFVNNTVRVSREAVSVQRPSWIDLISSLAQLTFFAGVKRFQDMSDKLYTTFILHPAYTLLYDRSTLCYTKNMVTITDIWSERDVRLVHTWLKALNLEGTFEVRSCTTDVTGVCAGACVQIIHDLMKRTITNESELINAMAKYKGGFSSEAAAIQTAYAGIVHYYLKQIPILFNCADKRDWWILKADLDNFIYREAIDLPTYALSKVAQFLDLKIAQKRDFTIVEEKYNILFSRTEKHVVVLLKYNFGTYIVDPNDGLNRWTHCVAKTYSTYNQINPVFPACSG